MDDKNISLLIQILLSQNLFLLSKHPVTFLNLGCENFYVQAKIIKRALNNFVFTTEEG